MKKIAIVSLHFSPGFIGHMKAWYKMCETCDLKPILFIDEEYIKYFQNSDYMYTMHLSKIEAIKPDYAVVQNTGFENVAFFKWASKNNCKIFYILHEPYMGLKELLQDGTYCVKQIGACLLNVWLCRKSTKVILCSDYAEKNCKRYMHGAYKKMIRFPLLFLDEYTESVKEKRKYFSLIGTYAFSKGSDLFIRFIKESVIKDMDIDFQIATRSDLTNVLKDSTLEDLMNKGKLIVQHGRNMTTEEINAAYGRSICCWNGYRRSTQSGVLPNAFMMGTPVLATKLGSFEEFVKPEVTGEFINNENTDSIFEGYKKIKSDGKEMSLACRNEFLSRFFYKNQAAAFKKIIDDIG